MNYLRDVNVAPRLVGLAVAAYETTGPNQERDAEIILRCAMGQTLEAIGPLFGLSRERARQIVTAHERAAGKSYRGVFAVASGWRRQAPKMDALDRFQDNIRVTDDGCWMWTGTRSGGGYGYFARNGEKYAHRWAVKTFKGGDSYAWGKRLHTDHLCRNRACANPDHLEVVTCQTNIRRSPMRSAGTHCLNGHEYTSDNTYWRMREGQRYRECRECKRMYDARYRDERKEAA